MRSDNHFVVHVIFSIFSIIVTIIYGCIIISQNNTIKEKLQSNQNQNS